MIEVVARIPTVEEYSTLRASVGWKVAGAEDCATALDATVAGAVVEVEGETIAMGRTVGDEVFTRSSWIWWCGPTTNDSGWVASSWLRSRGRPRSAQPPGCSNSLPTKGWGGSTSATGSGGATTACTRCACLPPTPRALGDQLNAPDSCRLQLRDHSLLQARCRQREPPRARRPVLAEPLDP